MMKKISHKILATVMAFVVLFSTMSFTIDMHFCGDTLVATSMFQKATGTFYSFFFSSSDGRSISNFYRFVSLSIWWITLSAYTTKNCFVK